MDLDTALYHVLSDDLGIRVSSLDEAKILVNRTAELGLTPYNYPFDGIPERYCVYGADNIEVGPTFWSEDSYFTRSHDIIDFCDIVTAPIGSTDIQNLL